MLILTYRSILSCLSKSCGAPPVPDVLAPPPWDWVGSCWAELDCGSALLPSVMALVDSEEPSSSLVDLEREGEEGGRERERGRGQREKGGRGGVREKRERRKGE